jgi:pilus retraction protein PilT
MTKLDDYIKTLMTTPGARAMTVRSDLGVDLQVGGVSRPAAQPVMSADELTQALTAILPQVALATFERGPYEFRYVSPYGPVKIMVQRQGIKVIVRLAPDVNADDASPRDSGEARSQAEQQREGRARTTLTLGSHWDLHLDGALDLLLSQACALGATDLLLLSGAVPRLRLGGRLCFLDGVSAPDAEQLWTLLEPALTKEAREQYRSRKEANFAFSLAGGQRVRCHLCSTVAGPSLSVRFLTEPSISAEQLGLPQVLLDWCGASVGLVLLAGGACSGRSTTLAALVDHINSHQRRHIIVLEEPVERIHHHKLGLVTQREVGTDAVSWPQALRAVGREAPDVLCVDDIADAETMSWVLERATTCCLVLATVTAAGAGAAVQRLEDLVMPSRRPRLRRQVADCLIGACAQTFCLDRSNSLVAAFEYMSNNPTVAARIDEGKAFHLGTLLNRTRDGEMQSLNTALLALVEGERIAPCEAYRSALEQDEMGRLLDQQGYHGPWSQGA